jgi:glycosyltransferase involved in cell wall biosynthesis
MIDDLAALPVPFFVYYDSSWDALISANDSADAYAALRLITPSNMARRRERQLAVYERATGVIAMSHWFARSLVEQSGVSPGKVHVVHGGVSSGRALRDGHLDSNSVNVRGEQVLGRPLRERAAPRRRLLFVGRQYHAFDFYRKGGDLVVAALALLRRDYDPEITLTLVGPEKWPLPGNPPDGVRFLGVQAPESVAALYDTHDLFVMPSRLEPFGVAFVEALSRGLPCIARDAYAMPEIVTHGVSGALITKDDEHELATTIAAALADDALYEACYSRAPRIAKYFSWERAAGEVAHVIAHHLGQRHEDGT